jgi:hypothetical protein
MDNKAREINSPVIKQLIDETSPEELAKIDTEMTNNKQQTPVQFYLDKVFDIIGDDVLDKLSNEQLNKIRNLGIQAKEMEKAQIAKAFDDGDYNYHYSRKTGNDFEDGQEYFNELYK